MNKTAGAIALLLLTAAAGADDGEWLCVPNAAGNDWDCGPRNARQQQAPPEKNSPVPSPAPNPSDHNEAGAAQPCPPDTGDDSPRVIYSLADDGSHWECRLNPDTDSWDCMPVDPAAAEGAPPKKPATLHQTHGSREWVCTPLTIEKGANDKGTSGGDWQCSRQTRAAEIATRNAWNWVPARYLTPAQRCGLEPGCDGLYVEPARDWPGADRSPMTAPLQASARRSSMAGERVSLEGDVEIRKGNLSLEAGSAEFRRDEQHLTLKDGVALRQPGLLLRGDSAEIDTDTALGYLRGARFLSYDAGARASAEKIERPSEQRLKLKKASYTQCAPDNETWVLKSSRIELDYESGRGVARNSTVELYGVPAFYLPWINFPVDDRRATGVLWPSFGSNNGGLDISVPYYLNLAPDYDMTLSPRYLEQRGEMLETEFRYLNRYSDWKLSSAYLPNDKLAEEDRWLTGVEEHGTIARRWQTAIDYTRVSDEDYFRDLGTSNLAVRRSTHLNQRAEIGYLGNRWVSQLKVQQYQTIADVEEPYRKLPQWHLEYRPRGVNFAPEPILLLDLTRFDHRQSIEDGGTEVTGDRGYGEAGLRFPMHWRAGYVIPSFKVRNVRYSLDTNTGQSDPETTVNQASLDTGLYLERLFAGGDWTQTLEPRLYYLFAEQKTDQAAQPDFDTALLDFSYEQLFRETRFTGYDRLQDADQAALGLRTRFVDNRAGREVLSLALGQLFYFDERHVQLPGEPVESDSNSEIATALRYYPTPNSWFTTDLLWDSHEHQITQNNVAFHYRAPNDALYNLGYSLRRNRALGGAQIRPVEQVDASLTLPLGRQWQLFAGWHFDIREDRSLESLAGVSYQNCCWLVRVVFQRSAEPDTSNGSNDLTMDETVLLEFQLKGLGGIGDKIASVLEESIFGYRDEYE